jgi:predicted GNAT family N-acyltransferase
MCLKKRMEYARWQDAYEISYGAIDKAIAPYDYALPRCSEPYDEDGIMHIDMLRAAAT